MNENEDVRSDRLDWIDAARGLAVGGVVLVHSAEWAVSVHSFPRLFEAFRVARLGVQLFFVISGFTISLTLSQHLLRNGKSARSYWAWILKRFFRIAPLYYLAIIVYFFERLSWTMVGSEYQRYPLSYYIENIFFIHEWIPDSINSVVLGGWSIGVEFSFYLIAPVFVPWICLKNARLGRVVMVIGACTIINVVMCFILPREDVYENFRYFWLPSQMACFIAGIWLFFDLEGRRHIRPPAWVLLAILSAGAVLATICGERGGVAVVFVQLFSALAFWAFLLYISHFKTKFIVNSIMRWFGKLSYSIYIVHFAVLRLIVVVTNHFLRVPMAMPFTRLALIYPATFAVSACIANISFAAIEAPGIRLGRRLSEQILRKRLPAAPR